MANGFHGPPHWDSAKSTLCLANQHSGTGDELFPESILSRVTAPIMPIIGDVRVVPGPRSATRQSFRAAFADQQRAVMHGVRDEESFSHAGCDPGVGIALLEVLG
jgi:hypothetical protein